MTLPQALAQSLQCPLLDPEAPPPPRLLPARTLPSQPLGQTATSPAAGAAVTATKDSSPQSEAVSAHTEVLGMATAVEAQHTVPHSPALAEAAEAAAASDLLLNTADHQPVSHLAQTTILRQGQQQQQKMNSFMVSGQRRVAKRPRVREHRR